MKNISIVIPLYNEEKRLDYFFKNFSKFKKVKKNTILSLFLLMMVAPTVLKRRF